MLKSFLTDGKYIIDRIHLFHLMDEWEDSKDYYIN
jgi:hypothetical protein